jgi:hypothetical protein
MMLLAVAQQEDEVPSVRREAVSALTLLLEDDTRKIEVGLPPCSSASRAHLYERQWPSRMNLPSPCDGQVIFPCIMQGGRLLKSLPGLSVPRCRCSALGA